MKYMMYLLIVVCKRFLSPLLYTNSESNLFECTRLQGPYLQLNIRKTTK